MAKLELVGKVRAKVMTTGAELGARVASRALDALQRYDETKPLEKVRGRILDGAGRLPIIGKRLRMDRDERALTEREEMEDEQGIEAEEGEAFAADVDPHATKMQVDGVIRHPEYFKGRKTVTARGRKTIPAAAAKVVRAKAPADTGFKAKRGQKHKKH